MKKLVVIFTAMILLFALISLLRTQVQSRSSGQAGAVAAGKNRVEAEGSAPAGAEAVEKVKESWAREQKLLASYEREQAKIRQEIINRRRLYQDGQIAKAEVLEVEQKFISMSARIHEVRRSMMESDMALSEATLKDDLPRLPTPALNGFRQANNLARFNGSGRWSLQQAKSVEKFFVETFGRNLPVTALGQTAAHNRMRFDHRDAMDVAVHPDSAEGKELVSYLRRSGIPFVAFRGAVPGSSTGAHIHIGQPSRRAAVN